MICYQDMTFCNDHDCKTAACQRHRSHVPEEPLLPVAWADFNEHNTCPAFENAHTEERRK